MNKTETHTARPPDEMRLKTQISSVFHEMPRGEMSAGYSAAMDTSSETGMPTGDMNRGNGLATGEMPSGQMTEAAESSAAGYTAIGSLSGQMTGGEGLTESEMPSGQMTSAQSATDNGLSVTDMPSGLILASSEQAEAKASDVFPVLEITGEWLLTLSPTSFKKSR
ncbi:MAG TPA: hypothetical protein VFS77_05270, partial [Pyrinomonadaceae bacterium]|nr:hypothetical protein [Pyrinomonadaceae bacterium]